MNYDEAVRAIRSYKGRGHTMDDMGCRLHEAAEVLERCVESLTRQRNQAWRTLHAIEQAVGSADESQIGFLLAGAYGVEDVEEYERVTNEEGE